MKSDNLTKRNKDYSVYVPSMQIGSATNVRMAAHEWQNEPLPANLEPKDFDYLRSGNSFWSYKYALASAETFNGAARSNAVTARDSTAVLIGDSGGYQIGKGTFGEAKKWRNFNAAQVAAAWRNSSMQQDITQWCELHCSHAMSIDIPLWVRRPGEKNSPFRSCSVKQLTELTVENLRYLKKVRQKRNPNDSHCKYLNVLQGDKWEDEKNWFDAVKKVPLDGWSLAGGVGAMGGPYRVLNRLLLLRDMGMLSKGFDWVHLLMVGKLRWSPFLTSVQRAVRKHVNDEFVISYDSSTAYKMGGKFENYYSSMPLTSDAKTWSQKPYKFPTTFGYANSDLPCFVGPVLT